MRTLLYSFLIICLYANSTTGMNSSSNQHLAQRQRQLGQIYCSQDTFVTLDHYEWRRIVEKRKTGNVVILEPEYHSPYNGNFIVTIKEIHSDKEKYIEKNMYLPSQPVAFVLGSAIVGAAFYWWYFSNNATISQ